ncbi:endonuclease/exonuclease/phosphatase family protein [Cardiosporidium cionae]|uniref:Endonuclease/exonuclease/phosphatase family protein n=1 Tax=Cardiosporidium cionae TaxID=476202 RepID=A0ABQ7JDG2_9APIC|nr:endonuclease/exonuclease/phosphatase family protein [Cardiosporidium cionae]|eukprot:KAF8822004.1 endonuclease/exonuclease/phosphatase family protein [Cardiosporidium cionae]
MNKAVTATHSILPSLQETSRFGWVNEIVDPVRLYLKKTGGLWFAWRRAKIKFKYIDCLPFPAAGQVPLSNQNVTVIELDLDKVFTGKRLLLFCTHFSTFSNVARESNLQTLRQFISSTLWKFYVQQLLDEQHFQKKASNDTATAALQNTAVLLCGDFNLDPHLSPAAYSRLRSLDGRAKMRDLFTKRENPEFSTQTTYFSQENSFEEDCKGNSLFPWPFKGRIDYIFGIDEIKLTSLEVRDIENTSRLTSQVFPSRISAMQSSNEDFRLTFERIRCIGMHILTQRFGKELSDHWPLSANLTLASDTPTPSEKKAAIASIDYSQDVKNSDFAGTTSPTLAFQTALKRTMTTEWKKEKSFISNANALSKQAQDTTTAVNKLEIAAKAAPKLSSDTAIKNMDGKASPSATTEMISVSQTIPKTISQTFPKTVPQTLPETVPQTLPKTVPQTLPKTVPQTLPKSVPQTLPKSVPQTLPKSVPQTLPKSVPQTLPKTDAALTPRATSATTAQHVPLAARRAEAITAAKSKRPEGKQNRKEKNERQMKEK